MQRRASLVAGVLGLCACIITPDDLRTPAPPMPYTGPSREVLEYRAWTRECRGRLDVRELCLEKKERARRNRTNR